MTRNFRPAASLLATTALALTLGACKVDNRPLLARHDAPAEPVAAAPMAQDPGPLNTAQLSPAGYLPAEEAYAYPQRAYAMSQVVSERPPSYAFDYQDEQPYAWDAADQGMMFAEPVDDGYRYYYYERGASYPYFVQDPDYSYAYGDGGVLLALFDAAGVLVAQDRYRNYAPRAETYWTRAYDLQQTYGRTQRHQVEERAWRERAPRFVESHDRWFREASARPAWRETHRDNGRHLGWYKDRDGKDHGDKARIAHQDRDLSRDEHARFDRAERRQIAATPASPRHADDRGDREHGRDAKPWREAKVDKAPERTREPRQAARHEERRAPDHGQKAGHDERKSQLVRAANDHGQEAAARGGAKPRQEAKHEKPRGGQTNGHKNQKGGDHHDKGDGHGKGGGKDR